MAMDESAYTVQEVADYLKISRQMVYNLIRNKEIASFNIGSAVRVLDSDLRAYIDAKRAVSASKGSPLPRKKPGMVQISHLSVRMGTFHVTDIDVEFPLGASLGVIGPSGAGKTLLLRGLAGLTVPEGGHFLVDGEIMDHLGPGMRRVGFVFQDYSLYPHMAPRRNIGFPREVARAAQGEIDASVKKIASRLGISDEYLNRNVDALPEGIKQLVAIGRAENREAMLFVMDEPLIHLDAGTRREMRAFLSALRSSLGVTTIYAFNNADDALSLSDYLLVIEEGRAARYGTTKDVYEDPRSLSVMELLSVNGVNRVADPAKGPGWLRCFRPEETEPCAPGEGYDVEILDARLHDGQTEIATGLVDGGRAVRFTVPAGKRGRYSFKPTTETYFPAG
jgi:multiple sugar transport system ATP-binding protein